MEAKVTMISLKQKKAGGGFSQSESNLARDVLKIIVLVVILLVLFSAFLIIGDFEEFPMSQRKSALMTKLQKSQRELVR